MARLEGKKTNVVLIVAGAVVFAAVAAGLFYALSPKNAGSGEVSQGKSASNSTSLDAGPASGFATPIPMATSAVPAPGGISGGGAGAAPTSASGTSPSGSGAAGVSNAVSGGASGPSGAATPAGQGANPSANQPAALPMATVAPAAPTTVTTPAPTPAVATPARGAAPTGVAPKGAATPAATIAGAAQGNAQGSAGQPGTGASRMPLGSTARPTPAPTAGVGGAEGETLTPATGY